MLSLGGNIVTADVSGLQSLIDLITNPETAKKALAELLAQQAEAKKQQDILVGKIKEFEALQGQVKAEADRSQSLHDALDGREQALSKREATVASRETKAAEKEASVASSAKDLDAAILATSEDNNKKKADLDVHAANLNNAHTARKVALEAEYVKKSEEVAANLAKLNERLAAVEKEEADVVAMKADYETKVSALRQLVK